MSLICPIIEQRLMGVVREELSHVSSLMVQESNKKTVML